MSDLSDAAAILSADMLVQFDARLSRIEALLERLVPPPDARAAERLAVLYEGTKGRDFSGPELLTHARQVDDALKTMLTDALIDNGKQLGKFLARLEKASVNSPLRLVRVGLGRDGIVWRVQVLQVSPPQNSQA